MAKTGTTTEQGVDRTQTLAPRGDSDRQTVGNDPTVRATGSSPGTAVTAAPLPTDDPDRYQPEGEHARGGLGRVVRALDTRLGRTVAVKELLRTSPQGEALFVREALITARLQHPGIVPVHEAGRWPSGEPYYVMKLVQGRTLKEVIAERATLHDRLALLPHAIAVAEAIGYAHSRGVIHRDVKPANVMVGDFGETVVVDWGLARDHAGGVPDLDHELGARDASSEPSKTSTVSGRVIGTPQYMAPEQARGEIVDERADVYSLGALLYELLSGRAPYAGTDPQAILDAVNAGPPRRLGEVVGGVPRDLDAIVHKAMAREPRARYASGKELAEDLKRFQSGQLVRAHSYGAVALARRWVSRHRGVVAVGAIAMAIVVVVAIVMFQRVVEERNVARDATAETRIALGAAENRSHQLTLLQARRSLAQDPTAVIAWLKAYPQPQLADAEIPAMIDEAIATGVARHVWRQRDFVTDAAFSPDGTLVATGSKDGDVRVYDAASGAMRVLGHRDAGVHSVAWSPDGKTLATGGTDGEVAVWDVAGAASRVLGRASAQIGRLRFSPDGARLLSTGEGSPMVWSVAKGGAAKVIDVDDTLMAVAVPADDWSRALGAGATGTIWRAGPNGGPATKVASVAGGVAAMGASPDGAIAIVSDGRALWRLDVAHGALTRLGDAPPAIKAIEFDRAGRAAAVGGDDPDITLVDLTTNTTRRLRGHTDALYEVHFSRDGRRLLSASDDGTARVWDLASGGARVLRGHTDDVVRASWSPREDAVVTASLDGSARLWPLAQGELAVWGGDLGAIERLTLVDDGRRVVAMSRSGRATAFDVATGARTELIPAGAAAASSQPHVPQISADGRWSALSLDDGGVALWRDGAGPHRLAATGWITDGVFAPAGDAAYTCAEDGTVRAWELASGQGRLLYQEKAAAWGLAIAPDGRELAVGIGDHVVLLDPDGRERARAPIDVHAPLKGCEHAIVFDRSGTRVAIERCDSHVVVWTPAHGAPVALDAGRSSAVDLAFSPDGARLAGAMADRTVRVWDTRTGKLVASLGGHTDLVERVAFSPDGRRLASASYDRTVRIWDPDSGASRVLRGHDGSVEALAWSADGARLYTGARDGTVRAWAAPSLAPPVAADVRASLSRVTTAVIAVDDRPATPSDTTPGG